jgi:hypothetical protein
MTDKIRIQAPCSADWNKMSEQNNGRFCESCQTLVVDFSTKSLDEIQNYFKEYSNQKVCGNYHIRHTSESPKWMNILTFFEYFLNKIKLRKFAFIMLTIVLFIAGCTRKHLKGRYSYSNDKSKKSKTSILFHAKHNDI